MATKTAATTDALKILRRRYYDGKPERRASLEDERLNAKIAREICELRTRAGLSQRQLATLVGTTASVICRLEDADYEGRSLSLLQRIAAALENKVEVQFVPVKKVLSRVQLKGKRSRSVTPTRRSPVRAARKKVAR